MPVETREYCEIIGMVAYGAGFARDEEGLSERQHIGRVRTEVLALPEIPAKEINEGPAVRREIVC